MPTLETRYLDVRSAEDIREANTIDLADDQSHRLFWDHQFILDDKLWVCLFWTLDDTFYDGCEPTVPLGSSYARAQCWYWPFPVGAGVTIEDVEQGDIEIGAGGGDEDGQTAVHVYAIDSRRAQHVDPSTFIDAPLPASDVYDTTGGPVTVLAKSFVPSEWIITGDDQANDPHEALARAHLDHAAGEPMAINLAENGVPVDVRAITSGFKHWHLVLPPSGQGITRNGRALKVDTGVNAAAIAVFTKEMSLPVRLQAPIEKLLEAREKVSQAVGGLPWLG